MAKRQNTSSKIDFENGVCQFDKIVSTLPDCHPSDLCQDFGVVDPGV